MWMHLEGILYSCLQLLLWQQIWTSSSKKVCISWCLIIILFLKHWLVKLPIHHPIEREYNVVFPYYYGPLMIPFHRSCHWPILARPHKPPHHLDYVSYMVLRWKWLNRHFIDCTHVRKNIESTNCPWTLNFPGILSILLSMGFPGASSRGFNSECDVATTNNDLGSIIRQCLIRE